MVPPVQAVQAVQSARGPRGPRGPQRGSEEQLESLWQKLQIPRWHRLLYLERYCCGDYPPEVLHLEVKALSKGTALVQVAQKAVDCREVVLAKLAKLREENSDAMLLQPKSQPRRALFELLAALRLATVEAVEAVTAWRRFVAPPVGRSLRKQSSPRDVDSGPSGTAFMWSSVAGPSARGACWPHGPNGEDYFLAISRNDAILRSFAPVLELSEDADPLLVHGVRHCGGVGPLEPGKLCAPVAPQRLQMRAEAAWFSLLEEELAVSACKDRKDGKDSRATSLGKMSPAETPSLSSPSPTPRLVLELTAPLQLPAVKQAGSQQNWRSTALSCRLPRAAQTLRDWSQTKPCSEERKGSNNSKAQRESIKAESSEKLHRERAQGSTSPRPNQAVAPRFSVPSLPSVASKDKGETGPQARRQTVAGKDSPDETRSPFVTLGLIPTSPSNEQRDAMKLFDVERIEAAFRKHGAEGNLHIDELAEAMKFAGFALPNKQWLKMSWDQVTSFNVVSLEEFAQIAKIYDDFQHATFKRDFESFDADGSGQLDLDELSALLLRNGIEPLRHVLEDIIDEVDPTANGLLSIHQFSEVMKLLSKREGFTRSEHDGFLDAFHKFDSKRIGKITVKHFTDLLCYIGFNTSPEEAQELVKEASPHISDELNPDTFIAAMRVLRETSIAKIKQKVQQLANSEGSAAGIQMGNLLLMLQSGGYFTEEDVIQEVASDIGITYDPGASLTLSEVWRFLAVYRKREGLKQADADQIVAAFRLYSDNHEFPQLGQIAVRSLPKCLRHIGYPLSFDDGIRLMGQVDVDGSGELSMTEFMKMVRIVRERKQHRAEQQFMQYYYQEDGSISSEDAKAGLIALGVWTDFKNLPPAVKSGLTLLNGVNRAAFVRFSRLCDEQMRRDYINRGSFTMDEYHEMKTIFASYDDDGNGEITKTEMIRLVSDLFRDISTDAAMRPMLVSVMNEACDEDGVLRFEQFLKLMRTVEDFEHSQRFAKEEAAAAEALFSKAEVAEFRDIFISLTSEMKMNKVSFQDCKDQLATFLPMGEKNTKLFETLWTEVLIGGTEQDTDFSEFMLIMRRIVDSNFGETKEIRKQQKIRADNEGSRRISTNLMLGRNPIASN